MIQNCSHFLSIRIIIDCRKQLKIPVTFPLTQPDVLYLSQLAEVSAAESVGYHNNESKIMCHCYSQFHYDGNNLQKSAQIRKRLQESWRLLAPSNSKRFAGYKADTGK